VNYQIKPFKSGNLRNMVILPN